MNEKGANIDLLFRNGLKDYEVLPPPGVWDNIHPVIKIKSKPTILLRIAAAITVLLTLSVLTYRWSREMLNSTPDSVVAFNIKTSSPIVSNSVDNRQYVLAKEYSQVRNPSDISIETDNINSYSGFKPYGNSKWFHNFVLLTINGTVQTSNPDVFLTANGSERIVTD